MALAVDVIERHGPNNEILPVTAKKTKVTLYYSLTYIPAKGISPATKTEHFSFKNGCVIRVKNVTVHRKTSLVFTWG